MSSFTAIYCRFVLDNQRWSQRTRAMIGFWAWMLPTLAVFAWLSANTAKFLSMSAAPKYDWSSDGWANAYIPFCTLQITTYLCQTVSSRCFLSDG